MQDVNFIPLVNMSEDDVIFNLKKSKVYIDFGHHPGRDRFPREAVLNNNIIITNFRGSALFYNDIPIHPVKYKFESNDILDLCGSIKSSLENYSEKIKDFKLYKSMILNQKDEFIIQVKQNFISSPDY
jgi:hypothetical protein